MTDPGKLPSHASRLQQALTRELCDDESVQWHGWMLGRTEWRAFGIYVFAIPWTLFSLTWTAFAAAAVMQIDDSAAGWISWAFPLFGLPFILVGFGMLAMPFVPVYQRGRVLFVVTDRRVLKLALGRDLVITAVPADRIGLTERREKIDGTGSLRLAIRVGRDSDGDRQTEFFDLGEVEDVGGAHTAIDRIAARGTSTPPRRPQFGRA